MAAAVSTVSQKAWIETRGAGAMCSPAASISAGSVCVAFVITCQSSLAEITCQDHLPRSLADIADLACVLVRIDRLGGLAAVILVEHRGAPSGVGRHLAARLHQIGLVLDHGGEIALRRTAEIPVVDVLVVLAVGGRAEVVRPEAARSGLREHGRVAELEGAELAGIVRRVWT